MSECLSTAKVYRSWLLLVLHIKGLDLEGRVVLVKRLARLGATIDDEVIAECSTFLPGDVEGSTSCSNCALPQTSRRPTLTGF